MKTLKELVEAQKSRKGKSTGTTKRGAYWLVGDPLKIRSYGGDGIGQNSPDHKHFLELRHFRSGEVRATIQFESWHQNGSYSGAGNSYHDVSEILNCTTVEDVIVALKSKTVRGRFVGDDVGVNVYSDSFADKLSERLTELGMVESLPAPDGLGNGGGL